MCQIRSINLATVYRPYVRKITTAAYTSRIYDMVGRNISIQHMGRAGLQKYEYHRLLIDEKPRPGKMDSIDNTFGITKTLELVLYHLRELLVIRKVAIYYIIREFANPGNAPDPDPSIATSARYESIINKLVVFTNHNVEGFDGLELGLTR